METQNQHPTISEEVPEGFEPLSLLDMNNVHFNAQRTVITPEILASLGETSGGSAAARGGSAPSVKAPQSN